MKSLRIIRFFLLAGIWLFAGIPVTAQLKNNSAKSFSFVKKELNSGLVFSVTSDREELRTNKSFNYEEWLTGAAGYRWENRSQIYLPFRHEEWNYLFEAGPFFGKGELIDSFSSKVIDAETKLAGLRGLARAAYSSRFYFDDKNYTIVHTNVWAQYDLFRQNAEGTLMDSNRVTTPYDVRSEHSDFRVGIQARAGWGIGRLSPVNHFATASVLLEKYYPGRLFSEVEVVEVAREIGRIKHLRDARSGHSAEKELEALGEFLRKRFLLEPPASALHDWELTEFRPRFHGTRFEFGPFFNYLNIEPDFIYGGYAKFENQKYCSSKWNRNLSAGISYNGYKKQDWILLETMLGWNWFPNLKTEYGFGVKYIPGMEVDGLDDLGKVRHNIVPYLEYFKQVNSKYRIETALAWRIAPNDQFMLPGPEVSLSVYRSRY
jgi:hypothetical protein